MQKIYSLSPYFNTIKYMVYYYDVRIKQLNITKEALFDELSISHMTYKRAKEFDSNAGREMISKLNKYFGVNDIDCCKQSEYEKIVNQTIHRFYYRGENLGEFIPLLDSCIEDNNYLRPLFLLLKILINLVSLRSPKVVLEENKQMYTEIKKYNTEYLLSPFIELFLIVDITYNGNKIYDFNNNIDLDDNMKGLVYKAYCTNAYMAGKYDLCLYYAKECKEYFLKDSNYKRLVSVNLTYYACLNKLGEYKKCMIEAGKQLIYLEETEQNDRLISATKNHYYTACIGSQNYKEVVDSICMQENINSMEFMFLLIASKYNKDEYNNFIEKYKLEKNKYKEDELYHIDLIIKYLSRNNKSAFKDEIMNSKINIGLKDILVKKF